MRNRVEWTNEMISYLKENYHKGYNVVSEEMKIPLISVRKKAFNLGLRIRPISKEPLSEIKQRKPDTTIKFDKNKHVIKNSCISNKTPVWIQSERMTIYVKDGADIEAIKNKFINRNKGGI